MLTTLWQAALYAQAHAAEFNQAVREHLVLSALALGVALALGLPAGWLAARYPRLAPALLQTFNAVRVVPSLAILFLMLPYFGLSFTAAAVALIALALPPIVINTESAFRTLDPTLREAAQGLGMTPKQQLWRVEIPLALPLLLAGTRTATLEVLASATLAAFIGVGGLGLYITRGFALYDSAIMLVGAIPVALLALTAELTFAALQRTARTSLGL